MDTNSVPEKYKFRKYKKIIKYYIIIFSKKYTYVVCNLRVDTFSWFKYRAYYQL